MAYTNPNIDLNHEHPYDFGFTFISIEASNISIGICNMKIKIWNFKLQIWIIQIQIQTYYDVKRGTHLMNTLMKNRMVF